MKKVFAFIFLFAALHSAIGQTAKKRHSTQSLKKTIPVFPLTGT